jgi:MATE family multidrug resistance protein
MVPGTRAGSYREAWKLAYPTIIGMISSTVMWTVDTVMLGRVGKVELAAGGFGGVLVFTLSTIFVGMVQGVGTFVAQAKGAGRIRDCARFTWQGLYLSVAGALVMTLFLWKMDDILALAGPAPDVAHECVRYSRARLMGSFFLLGTFTCYGFFRGIGDMRTPMVIAVVANVFNIAMDGVLIFGLGPFPRLTTLGAGIATALAEVVAFVLAVTQLLRSRNHSVYGTRTERAFSGRAFLRLVRVGTPIGLQWFVDMSSFSAFMAIMGRLGTNEMAASQIAIQILSFSFMPANGIAKASTTMVGQYLGAGRTALAERCGWVALRMSVVYAALVAVIFALVRERLFALYTPDPAVIAAGVAVIPLLAVYQIGDATQMTVSGSLQGAGDTRFPMITMTLSAWLLFVPLAWFLTFRVGWGLFGGWLGGAVHFVVLSVVLLVRFKRGRWKAVRI